MNTCEPETLAAMAKLTPGTVAEQSNRVGWTNREPLIIAMDGLLRYAKAYRKAYDGPLADDQVLGPCWLAAAQGIRGLLNGQGVVAMERDISTDSKDNGVIEDTFWSALKAAGYEEKDL